MGNIIQKWQSTIGELKTGDGGRELEGIDIVNYVLEFLNGLLPEEMADLRTQVNFKIFGPIADNHRLPLWTVIN